MLLRFNKEQSLARQHLPTCSIQGRCAPQTLFSP
jgi:hypothetical protein